MRINIRNKGLKRFVQRALLPGVHIVFCVCLFLGTANYTVAAESEQSFVDSAWSVFTEVFRQMDGVMAYTAQAIDAVFSSTVRTQERQEEIGDILIPDPLPITSTRFPLSGVGIGTLVINAPLSITNTLTATGESFLSTTTVTGLLSADELALDALTVSGLVNAGALAGNQLTVRGRAQLNALDVSTAATVANLSVVSDTVLNGLTVNEATLVASLLVEGATQLTGVLEANAGIDTNGADVDLQGGSIYAANIVNQVIAGDGVTITGTTSAPIISVDTTGMVTEINGETGVIEIRSGTDISVSGNENMRITNKSKLSSVRARGGCAGCITDTDVSDSLTLTAGTIDGVVIGSSTIASAFFSDVTIGTTSATTTNFSVLGTGTANFGGSLNLDSGCFSIGGNCVVSAASSTSYVGLFDTPGSLTAGAVQYASSTGSTLTQSANFVFDGSSLAVGTTTPISTLTIEGDTTLTGALAANGTTTVIGEFNTTGNSALGGSLTVTASSTFTDTLTVGGFVTLQSDLSVTGTSTIGGGLVVSGATTLSDQVTVDGNISIENGASVRLYDADSSNYVAFTASTSLVGNTTWVLPDSDGNADEVMVTDGNGSIRFEPVSAIGGGVTEYTNLIDTPGSFASGTIPYGNASGTAIVHSVNLRYDGTNLSVGPSQPSAELTVDGSVDFVAVDGSIDFTFDDTAKLIGIGTVNPTDKLTLQGGSIKQLGGSSGNVYSPNSIRVVPFLDTVSDVVVSGSFAYTTTDSVGDDFHILNMRNTSNPVEIGSLDLPASAKALEVTGRYAYVVSTVTGDDFHVIDLADKTNPVELNSINLSASGNDLDVSGDYAYVATDGSSDNFTIIDISNPAKSYIVGTTSLPASVKAVEVRGDYAYVTTEVVGDDFHVIDVSDPTSPTVVESIGLPTSAISVALSDSGQYAFVGTDGSGDDLHTIDISNPLSVSLVDSLSLDAGATSAYVAGDLLYVTTYNSGNDVYVIDATNPTALAVIGQTDFGAGNTYSSVAVGKYVYVAAAGGLLVVDVSGAQSQSVYTYSLETRDMFVAGYSNFANGITVSGSVDLSEDLRGEGVLRFSGTDTSYLLGGLSVGTTSTSTGLLVDGTITSTDFLGGATNITTDANGNLIRDPSDIRLKKNITTIDGALDSLLQLRGVSYQWRDAERFGSQTEIGFIAQEVDPILPEVIRKGGDYWSINTRNIIAVVVEAVKEVWGELQGTQQEVDDLRQRVGQLEEQLNEESSQAQETEVEDLSTDVPNSEEEEESVDDSEDTLEATESEQGLEEQEKKSAMSDTEENSEVETQNENQTGVEEGVVEAGVSTGPSASSTEVVVSEEMGIEEVSDEETAEGGGSISETEEEEVIDQDVVFEESQENSQDEVEILEEPVILEEAPEETVQAEQPVTEESIILGPSDT